MHHAVGIFAIVGAIAFAFGKNVARAVVGTALVAIACAFAYVMFRVVTGTI